MGAERNDTHRSVLSQHSEQSGNAAVPRVVAMQLVLHEQSPASLRLDGQ